MRGSQSRESKQAVRKFFDEGVERWQSRYFEKGWDPLIYRDRMLAALELLKRYGPGKGLALDAGCGAGVQAAALASEGPS